MVSETQTTSVDLIRHGEHEFGEVVCGVSDPKLTQKGWDQLSTRIDALKVQQHDWDVCISSPRSRCKAFAESVSDDLGIPCVVDQGFAEVDFGQWECLSYPEINAQYPGQWQEWIARPHDTAPHGGEKYGEFLERVHHAWESVANIHRGKRVLLFAHGGVIRAVFRSVLSLDSGTLNRFSVPHACHTRVVTYHHPGKPDLAQLDRHNTF